MKFDIKKIDKEFLLKNRFWILLGVSTFLTLLGMFYLEVYVDAEADRKAIVEPLTSKKPISGPQSDKTIAERKKIAAIAQEKESLVWADAFSAQESMYVWSNRIEEEFEFNKGKFALDITIGGPLNDPKMWPEDNAALMHGKLVKLEQNAFTLENRKGVPVRFHLTNETQFVTEQGKPGQIPFPRMSTLALKKLVIVKFQTGKYFADPLTTAEQRTFAETYKSQIHPLLKEINPLDDKGSGVVQLRNWLYREDDLPPPTAKFLRYVSKDWEIKNDISKEAWIAQENLCIHKEIYHILRKANETISAFDSTDKQDAKSAKNEFWEVKNKSYSFKNQYFELILSLNEKQDLSFKIKNLQQKRQKLDDLSFRIHMNKGFPAEVINISSYPLEPAGAGSKKDSYEQIIPLKEAKRKGIYSVEQILSWKSAAVKRLDQIAIGSEANDDCALSHRNLADGLTSLDPEDRKEDDGKKPAAAPTKTKKGGKGERPKAAGPGDKLPHGLWTDRYVEVTEQSRRVPVCVVVIVDQAQVDRVLSSFNANSRLRFLQTQVLWNQYTGSLQPPAVVDKPAVGGLNPPNGKFQPPNLKGGQPRIPPPNQGGLRPRPDGGGGNTSPVLDANIELVIYGIVTLYQRYPPKPVIGKK